MSSEILKYAVDILLVENNPADVHLTEEALENAKLLNSLTVVEDGEAALDYLFQRGKFKSVERPHLVLLDLNLPKIDGREVLKIMKTDKALKSIPVVILISSDADRELVRTFGLCPDCCATKPIDLDRLIEIVKSIDQFWLEVLHLPQMAAHS